MLLVVTTTLVNLLGLSLGICRITSGYAPRVSPVLQEGRQALGQASIPWRGSRMVSVPPRFPFPPPPHLQLCPPWSRPGSGHRQRLTSCLLRSVADSLTASDPPFFKCAGGTMGVSRPYEVQRSCYLHLLPGNCFPWHKRLASKCLPPTLTTGRIQPLWSPPPLPPLQGAWATPSFPIPAPWAALTSAFLVKSGLSSSPRVWGGSESSHRVHPCWPSPHYLSSSSSVQGSELTQHGEKSHRHGPPAHHPYVLGVGRTEETGNKQSRN